jgi:adenine deaminase
MRNLQQKLSIARGETAAELLLRNANLINVLSGEIHKTHVAVDDGRVIGLGEYEAKKVIDLDGAYLAPSLIDGHFHVESSMLTMPEFARAVVPHGTGAVVIDPHEYANVLGLDGIRYVLESSKNLPIDFFIMLPSCVPATPLETAGARLTADDLRLMIADERIAGVAELMNYPGIYLGLESELAKIEAGKGKNIDGHAPGLRGRNLNAYVLAGVRSDHESTELAEAQEKLRLGLHLLLREGSTERNLATLAPLVNSHNAMNCSFATDDKLAGDLVSEGHIDHCVRKAIEMGMEPVAAIQIATISTARHYHLRNFGAIAPRYWADFIVFDDLNKLVVRQTYKKGVLVAEKGKYLAPQPAAVQQPRSTMNVRYDPLKAFEVRVEKKGAEGETPSTTGGTRAPLPMRIRVIGIVPNQIVTRELTETPRLHGKEIVADVERDILKLVVLERHHATGNIGIGFVRGFKLKTGALGSTVAHDAHNIVVVGTNDADIVRAIDELENMQGGQVAVAGGVVRARLPLPIAGLVSDRPLDEVIARISELNAAAREMGCELEAPFMSLSFLSLSPIPELKLTDQGLIDSVNLRKTGLIL